MNRKIPGCNECNEPKTCKNLDILKKVRTGALQVGMLIKTDKNKEKRQQLIKKWTTEIKNKYPTCFIDIQT